MSSRRDRSRPAAVQWLRASRASRCAGALLTASVLAGCAAGGGVTGQGLPTSPRADLAAEAEVAAGNLAHEPGHRRAQKPVRASQEDAASRRGSPADRDDGSPGDAADPGAGTRPPARPTDSRGVAGADGAPTSWTPLLTLADPARDQGGAPTYADALGVDLDDDGRQLRVVVRLGDVVPGRLGAREVQGVGVDLFRADAVESDYQLFLDGGDHGWRGFLQTPHGFVPFPGTVTVRGPVLSAVVPWAAVGGRREADVAAFVDWSDAGGRTGSDQVARGRFRPS